MPATKSGEDDHKSMLEHASKGSGRVAFYPSVVVIVVFGKSYNNVGLETGTMSISTIQIFEELKDWIMWLAIAAIVALVLGNGLRLALGNSTPLVAVMSGSMVHDETAQYNYYQWMQSRNFTLDGLSEFPIPDGFNKGDVLVVVKAKPEELKVGDVIVFHVAGQAYPIIHRIIGIENGRYLTKGDHNPGPDSKWPPVSYEQIEGRAVFKVPAIGFIKVLPLDAWNAIFGK